MSATKKKRVKGESNVSDTIRNVESAPESGTHRAAPSSVQRLYLADLALGALCTGELAGDDDPLLSCIDSLTIDMQILHDSLDSYHDGKIDGHIMDSAMDRFVARMRVIRALHVAKGGAS